MTSSTAFWNRFPTLKAAYAYGSNAFTQPASGASSDLLDFILIAEGGKERLEEWHRRNLKLNRKDYSWTALLGPRFLTWINRSIGSPIFFNTKVALPLPAAPPNQSTSDRPISVWAKYGVVSEDDFLRDLEAWPYFALCGRLHKPVFKVAPPAATSRQDEHISKAVDENRTNALRAALLLLPERFSLRQLLHQIVRLSYNGDVRFVFGAEDPKKIDSLVADNAAALFAIYYPLLSLIPQVNEIKFPTTWTVPEIQRLQALGRMIQNTREALPKRTTAELNAMILSSEVVVSQQVDEPSREAMFQMLPETLRLNSMRLSLNRRFGRIFNPTSVLLQKNLVRPIGHPMPWESEVIVDVLKKSVRRSSRLLLVKSALTVSPAKALQYALRKVVLGRAA